MGVRVNWFEIPGRDVDTLAAFYERMLGTRLGRMDGPAGPMRTFLAGEMPVGAIVNGESVTGGTVIYLAVEDVGQALAEAAAMEGEVLLGRTEIGPFGTIGRLRDPAGNVVAVHGS
ncbi:MAG: VOC family protein [Alphaproteobacteria bacterium]|nr:MAG: VOC family protein [Alphaproteobacteria bacterium]